MEGEFAEDDLVVHEGVAVVRPVGLVGNVEYADFSLPVFAFPGY